MQRALERIDWYRATVAVAPLAAIGLAALAIRTPFAAAYPRVAVILFVWVFADALMLSLVARTRPGRVEARTALAVLAGAVASAAIAMPAPFRAILLDLPLLAGTMAAAVAAHLASGLFRARASLARRGTPLRERAADAAAELLPRRLVQFMGAELSLLHLALFRWRAAPEVPDGQQGFAYHRHLLPIFSVLLFLQVMEIAIVHLLVSLWSPRAALILFALSCVALIYLVGLVKSFRLLPVLAGEDGIRVRAGILLDRFMAWEDVASIRTSFSSADVKRRGTEQAALLAWPNLLLELRRPTARVGLLGASRSVDAMAFRLDDPASFLRFAAPRLVLPAPAPEPA